MVESKADVTKILVHRNAAGEIVGYFAAHEFHRSLHGRECVVLRGEAGRRLAPPAEVARRLRSVALFEGLSGAQIAALAARAEVVQAPAGTVLVTVGELGSDLFVIDRGGVHITARGPDGEEVVLDQLDPGDVFGEIAALVGEPRSATVRSATRVTLARSGRCWPRAADPGCTPRSGPLSERRSGRDGRRRPRPGGAGTGPRAGGALRGANGARACGAGGGCPRARRTRSAARPARPGVVSPGRRRPPPPGGSRCGTTVTAGEARRARPAQGGARPAPRARRAPRVAGRRRPPASGGSPLERAPKCGPVATRHAEQQHDDRPRRYVRRPPERDRGDAPRGRPVVHGDEAARSVAAAAAPTTPPPPPPRPQPPPPQARGGADHRDDRRPGTPALDAAAALAERLRGDRPLTRGELERFRWSGERQLGASGDCCAAASV
ncbi:cyclic nucleotide-binding domain-containing protein [Nannocystis sp.]|uniref:cyclic nucleotide-binding domain-containing protein n=1 Tax=Nannocystis sp. TaxID=1962667 RepID=UPI0025D24083|nr:cyclic nucleotide-binding domain-containing protein [Nannocystis sp.]MBK7827510.1 cyclic nucleotide-binding domain-containing protein [Nannocystis sp.]